MSEGFRMDDRRRIFRDDIAAEPEAPRVSRIQVREEVRRINGQDVVFRIHPDGSVWMDRLADPKPETLESRPPTWDCPRHGAERDLNPAGAPAEEKRCLQEIVRWEWSGSFGPGYGYRGQNDARMQLPLEDRLVASYGPFRRHDGSPSVPPESRHEAPTGAQYIRLTGAPVPTGKSLEQHQRETADAMQKSLAKDAVVETWLHIAQDLCADGLWRRPT